MGILAEPVRGPKVRIGVNSTDVLRLDRKIVLVTSESDRRNPPTGRRGTLIVEGASRGGPVVAVELDFPEMYTSRAHRLRIVLSDEQIDQLVRTEQYGSFSLTVPGRLDPELAPGNE